MDAVGAIAIIILIIAVLVLIYYYLQNLKSFDTSNASESIKGFFTSPSSTTGEAAASTTIIEDDKESENKADEDKVSTVDKIKYSFKDIDMAAALNTEAFSKRLDAFLDEKSEELIENWSLATTSDLKSLEERCELACNNIDDLEKRFKEYSSVTDSKLDDLDKRLKALEVED